MSALALPVLVFITGIAYPLGLLPADALSFERTSAIVGSPLGRLAIFAVVSLTFWHAMHRIHHGLHDLGVESGLGVSKVLAYGAALVGTLVTAYFVITL